MHQISQIIDIDMAFMSRLINAIKKDKSFEIELWTKHQVDQLLPLSNTMSKLPEWEGFNVKEF